ncbi:XRE family transcriptional regulator [Streptomyces sp. NPDC030392]|uniref:XRE family transcriptional regulator n=1 Tax=unclassified Streptomyces TaxID=2593676 RepID=UPI0033C7C51A
MPRWKALPEELDPEVREFAGTLRRLVDRGGLGLGALADRTGYGRTSWERYLNGRLLAPKDAVLALAEATGTDPVHLVTLWELAERAWSRAEQRRDQTLEDIRLAQARAALDAPARPAPSAGASPGAAASASGGATRGGSGGGPGAGTPYARPGEPAGGAPYAPSAHRHRPRPDRPAAARPAAPRPAVPRGAATRGDGERHGRTVLMFFAGALGTLLVFGAVMLLSGLGDPRGPRPAARPADAKPAAPADGATPSLPVGVGCYRGACDGQDPHTMGCGGAHASTVASTIVDTALVEVRYSRACRASWARVSRAAPGDTVQVTAAGGATRSATADADGDAYTPMVVVPAGTDASACATLRSGATGCTEAP